MVLEHLVQVAQEMVIGTVQFVKAIIIHLEIMFVHLIKYIYIKKLVIMDRTDLLVAQMVHILT